MPVSAIVAIVQEPNGKLDHSEGAAGARPQIPSSLCLCVLTTYSHHSVLPPVCDGCGSCNEGQSIDPISTIKAAFVAKRVNCVVLHVWWQ